MDIPSQNFCLNGLLITYVSQLIVKWYRLNR